MKFKPQYIVTKLAMSGGHRHIFSRHATLQLAKKFVKDHRLQEIGFQPRIYKRVS